MKKTIFQLMITLICVYLAAIIIFVWGYYFGNTIYYINPLSQSGIVINTIVLLYTISSVPLSLALFNRQVKKWALSDNKNSALNKYRSAGVIRISLIGVALLAGLMMHFIMKSQSMLFSAGIAGVALVFCIPGKEKINNELNIEL